MNYRQAVAEGKRLLKRSEEDQWALAKLTVEVLADGVTQQRWSEDLGVSSSHVRILRIVGERYGDHDRKVRGRVRSFAEFYAMAKEPDEEVAETILAQADVVGKSVATLQRHLGYGDKVAAARSLLSDPQIAKDVLQDQRTRTTVARASMDVAAEQVHEQREAQARRAPELSQRSSVYDILGRLTSARRQIVTTLDQLRDVELDDEDREGLLEVAEQVETAVEWLMSYIRSGERSFDKALDRLLQEG